MKNLHSIFAKVSGFFALLVALVTVVNVVCAVYEPVVMSRDQAMTMVEYAFERHELAGDVRLRDLRMSTGDLRWICLRLAPDDRSAPLEVCVEPASRGKKGFADIGEFTLILRGRSPQLPWEQRLVRQTQVILVGMHLELRTVFNHPEVFDLSHWKPRYLRHRGWMFLLSSALFLVLLVFAIHGQGDEEVPPVPAESGATVTLTPGQTPKAARLFRMVMLTLLAIVPVVAILLRISAARSMPETKPEEVYREYLWHYRMNQAPPIEALGNMEVGLLALLQDFEREVLTFGLLRGVSALAGILTVLLTASAGWNMRGPRTGVIAGALVGFSNLHLAASALALPFVLSGLAGTVVLWAWSTRAGSRWQPSFVPLALGLVLLAGIAPRELAALPLVVGMAIAVLTPNLSVNLRLCMVGIPGLVVLPILVRWSRPPILTASPLGGFSVGDAVRETFSFGLPYGGAILAFIVLYRLLKQYMTGDWHRWLVLVVWVLGSAALFLYVGAASETAEALPSRLSLMLAFPPWCVLVAFGLTGSRGLRSAPGMLAGFILVGWMLGQVLSDGVFYQRNTDRQEPVAMEAHIIGVEVLHPPNLVEFQE